MYAESYGAHGHQARTIAEIRVTAKKCLQSKGVHLIEVPINCEERFSNL